jgi:hypothetical protein
MFGRSPINISISYLTPTPYCLFLPSDFCLVIAEFLMEVNSVARRVVRVKKVV